MANHTQTTHTRAAHTKAPIILAAGGTGGHIFPAEALAETLIGMDENVMLITDKRFARFQTGVLSTIEKRTIRAGGTGSSLYKIMGAAWLVVGIVQARRHLRKLQPKAVVGFGGYPSFPTVYAATLMGIPTVIHEQNSVLGRANRLLAPRASRIAISFPDTQMLEARDKPKQVLTGNPVRHSVRVLRDVPYPSVSQDGILRILVTGGSLGATVFSTVVPGAIGKLPASLRARVRIDQQCREADLADTRAMYQSIGVNADLAPFFVDLPARLAGSHLVIARSGASTVSELSAAGRPAILVPLPSAMDNHQYYNANAFEDVGGGWVMTQDGFTADSLAARLEAFLTLPETLVNAAESAKKFGLPDAAQKLAALVLSANGAEQTASGSDAAPSSAHRRPSTFSTEAA